jgi:hypothetical protein
MNNRFATRAGSPVNCRFSVQSAEERIMSDARITVHYEASTGKVWYDPDTVTVAQGEQATITVVFAPDSEGATFYGFASFGWSPTMPINITDTQITITDPNTQHGRFDFRALLRAPKGGVPAVRNPDPTILNEPIGGTVGVEVRDGGEQRAA